MNKSSMILLGVLIVFSLVAVAAQTNIVNLRGGIENLVLEENGAVPVNLQDQHTEIIDLLLHREIDTMTLNQTYAIGDTELIVETTGEIPSAGHSVCFKETRAFYQAIILSVTPINGNYYTIVLDTPLDYSFGVNANACISTVNMAIDGSVTPQTFHVSPEGLDPDVEWDITRILFVLSGEGIGATNDHPDDSDFGVTGVLTNGIILRSINGVTKNIFNIKRNGEFRLRAYDVTYTEKSKAGLYSVGVRRSFAGVDKNGVTVRLVAERNDTIEIIIQDDLTEMFGFKAVVQGHVVTD